MMDHKSKWYLDEVRVKIEGATQEALNALALQLEGLTKINIQQNGQIDTGFMLNSVYSRFPDQSSYGDAVAGAMAAAGKAGVEREFGPEEALPEGVGAMVVVGAGYAIYQEAQQSFLYRAAEELARQAGGTVEGVFKEKLK